MKGQRLPGAPWFRAALQEHFPGARPEAVYVGDVYERLFDLGFDEHTAIACVTTCRDELTQPTVSKIQAAYGSAFNFSSLAGMLYIGQTGFGAAVGHAPRVEGKSRYVFFVLPHIGLDENGQVGVCRRQGQDQTSKACGALVALCQELTQGPPDLSLDPNDLEQSLLRRALVPQLAADGAKDLITLTRLALRTILRDLEALIAANLEPHHHDYAVVTGLLVHGPDDRDFVMPDVSYAVVDGTRRNVEL